MKKIHAGKFTRPNILDEREDEQRSGCVSYRILVIEGAALKRRFLDALQSRMNDGVFRFVKGADQAVALFNAHSFDMVLSDSTAPEMDLVSLLQQLSSSASFPALAVFGHTSRRVMINTSLMARHLGFSVIGRVLTPLDIIDLRDLQRRSEHLQVMLRAGDWPLDVAAGQADGLSEHEFWLRFRALNVQR